MFLPATFTEMRRLGHLSCKRALYCCNPRICHEIVIDLDLLPQMQELPNLQAETRVILNKLLFICINQRSFPDQINLKRRHDLSLLEDLPEQIESNRHENHTIIDEKVANCEVSWQEDTISIASDHNGH